MNCMTKEQLDEISLKNVFNTTELKDFMENHGFSSEWKIKAKDDSVDFTYRSGGKDYGYTFYISKFDYSDEDLECRGVDVKLVGLGEPKSEAYSVVDTMELDMFNCNEVDIAECIIYYLTTRI